MNLQQLREKLKRGFYVDNLYEMASLCKSLALGTNNPVPFFVMERIFLDIAGRWEEIPLTVEKARMVELNMTEPLEDIVEGIEEFASSEEILNLLNRLIFTYLRSPL